MWEGGAEQQPRGEGPTVPGQIALERSFRVRLELCGGESIEPGTLPNPLDAVSSTEFGEECVERVAASNLPAFSAQEPEPLAVVHGVAIPPTPENLDSYLAQPPPSQLAV